jgi:type IV secretory pathway VirB10-like protein
MNHGFRVSFSFSEFTMAAVLITIAALAVSFYTKQPTKPTEAAVHPSEPTVNNYYITVPTPQIHLKVVVPKPEPQPQTDMYIEPLPQEPPAPEPQAEKPKVWDNDNLLRASKESQ